MKKIIAIIAVISLLFLSIQPVNSLSLDNQNTINLPNNHLIEGIEYIAQTEGYFCYYSCFTMIFNNMGLNTSLDEVLFYDGLGTHTIIVKMKELTTLFVFFYCDIFIVDCGFKIFTGVDITNINDFYNSSKMAIIYEEMLLRNIEPLKKKSYEDYNKVMEIISYKNQKNIDKIYDLGDRYIIKS